ncbi:MAG: hypothetical protein EA353_04580 [Puniceicoccaceae bacterium]|nr:MAG: hypothetical protein EA353_04580 [Puniceicoccaceae bacterium]
MSLLRKFFIVTMGLIVSATTLCSQTNVSIKGAGFLEDRVLKSRLAFLQSLESDQAVKLDAVLIEDSAFLLLQQLKRSGYLKPTIEARLIREGETKQVTWTSPYAIQLDAAETAESVVFRVKAGVLAYYESVTIEGVTAMEADVLQRYFLPGGVLFQAKRSRVFTSENLDRRIDRVLRALDAQGYRDVELVSSVVESDPLTGATRVELNISQGTLYRIGSVTVSENRKGETSSHLVNLEPGTVLTPDWEQEQRLRYRNEAFKEGYPDAVVTLEKTPIDDLSTTEVVVDIHIHVDRGEAVRFGGVRFVGDERTSRSMLGRKLGLEAGAPLDRLEASRARRSIVGLGIFQQVDLSFEPESGPMRDVVYTLEPGVRKELDLLGGWGSYEQLRAGFEWEQKNPFGRAHRYKLKAKQSFKTSRAELSYSIPQFLNTDFLVYSNMQYSFREELSFERTRTGASVGTSFSTGGGIRVSAEYGFFEEATSRNNLEDFSAEDSAMVGSITLRLSYDRRDNFLAPSSGWNVFNELEIASDWLGGGVDFQRIEVGGGYHKSLGESSLLHLGVRAGSIFTSKEAATNIPFNKRFFNGGENTVRGFREGGASPLDANGDQIGAEGYALFNIEFEQRVYDKFSTVLFLDSVFNGRNGFGGKETQLLHSVGLGLRYQTVVGPVRLEYGHNLNPRDSDPAGRLHLSVGYPF